jgi:hypothetical protein
MSPAILAVCALYSLQNAMMFTPCNAAAAPAASQVCSAGQASNTTDAEHTAQGNYSSQEDFEAVVKKTTQ